MKVGEFAALITMMGGHRIPFHFEIGAKDDRTAYKAGRKGKPVEELEAAIRRTTLQIQQLRKDGTGSDE
jgi:hypothetical protein